MASGVSDSSVPADEEEQVARTSQTQSWGERFRLRNRFPGGRLLSRRFTNTSRFVVSSQVWVHTIPTRDCDILLTFPARTDDNVLMWLLSRLRTRTPELAVHVRHHSNTGVYGFYITSSYEHLLQEAEQLAIRKPLKERYGGALKEFVFEDQDYFEGVDDSTSFLTSQERQCIVKHMLYNLRAIHGDMLGKTNFLEGQAIVPQLVSKGIVKQVLPLHSSENLHYLRKHWVQAVFHRQPLDKICDYFGVKIAIYFAYLGHYTKSLMLPAFLGLMLWFISGQDQNTDDICFVVYALINMLWATLYLELWKRRSATCAYSWGTLDREDDLLVEPRPLFHGHLVRSPVTGRLEPVYPGWKRNMFRYFVTVPIILVCLSVVFTVMWWIFELQDWVNDKITREELRFFCKFLPKILLAICIGILDDVYKKIAYWLNDRENYRLDAEYETNLVIKLVLFVNSFLSLFYIAFYLQDMDRLKEQLAALLITRQVIGNIKEAVVPYVIEKLKLFKIGYDMTEGMSPATLKRQARKICGVHIAADDDSSVMEEEEVEEWADAEETVSNDITTPDSTMDDDGLLFAARQDNQSVSISHTGPQLTQAEVEANMQKYEDTFEDHLEMFIQFGYVTLFSCAFPLASLCALLNNVIEIRSDAFKLCLTFQRPFGQRVENIGTWQHALEILSMIAVMVNCALIGMSGLATRMFPDLGTTDRVIFIVILEHVILAGKLLLAYAIPDVPDWVAEEKARLEFLRRDALKKVELRNSPQKMEDIPPCDPSNDSGIDIASGPTGSIVDLAASSKPGLSSATPVKKSALVSPASRAESKSVTKKVTIMPKPSIKSVPAREGSPSRWSSVGAPPRSAAAASWTQPHTGVPHQRDLSPMTNFNMLPRPGESPHQSHHLPHAQHPIRCGCKETKID